MTSSVSTLRIHTSIESARAVTGIGERLVTQQWKQTTNQQRMERAIILPFENLSAPEVPQAFRPLVEAVLLASAEQTLKDHCNTNPNQFEVLPVVFSQSQLIENYLSTADNWMTREALEKSFVGGATWARITKRADFASNATYQAAANAYKDAILKLAAKPTYVPPTQRDVILAKLDESDLSTDFGAFILRRFDQMAKKDAAQDVVSFADL